MKLRVFTKALNFSLHRGPNLSKYSILRILVFPSISKPVLSFQRKEKEKEKEESPT